MDTLPAVQQTCLPAVQQTCFSQSSVCSDYTCRRAASLHFPCRVSRSSSDLTISQPWSLYRAGFQLSRHALRRSAIRASAVESSSTLSSSDAVEVEREEGMPVPGTITFRRSATQRHYEYLTDLEALGIECFSSELSRGVAISMGIPEAPTSEPTSTPASVSIDVTKEGRDNLRLNGIVRTALALNCNRCGIPVAERVFGEFSLLLTEQPVVEPTKHRIGVVLGEGGVMPGEEEDLEEVLDLDLDDKLHFPKTEKSIDISKYIRDTVYLELPLQCLCGLSCRGRCSECGMNLNEGICNCAMEASVEDKRATWGPLSMLKEQLESEGR